MKIETMRGEYVYIPSLLDEIKKNKHSADFVDELEHALTKTVETAKTKRYFSPCNSVKNYTAVKKYNLTQRVVKYADISKDKTTIKIYLTNRRAIELKSGSKIWVEAVNHPEKE